MHTGFLETENHKIVGSCKCQEAVASYLMVHGTQIFFCWPGLRPLPGSSMYGMFDVVPVAERTFDAKITDVFHYGYTIEATIDNKPLRGLLFSYKPGFAIAAHDYISRFDVLAKAI
jgi:hypothetical protein